MPARTDWDRYLKSKDGLPIVALVGTENILVSEAIIELRERSLTQAPDFNRDEFRAGETPIQQVIDAAGTLPMMAQLRWVHLYDIQRLKAADLNRLLAYIQKPCPTSILCLSGTKIDQRTKFGQALSKSGYLFQMTPPTRGAVVPWLMKRAKKHGFQLQGDAAHFMVDLIGSQIGRLDMAILKAGTYAGGEPIEVEHVESTVAATRVHTVFELTDAIGARNLPKASQLLRNILNSGESGLMILAMMVRQLRHLIHINELQDEGADKTAMAREIGVRPFVVDQLLRQSKYYSTTELRRTLQLTSGVDIRLKSSRLNHGVLLDQFLLQMMGSL